MDQARLEFERELNPAAACVIPIVESYLKKIHAGMRVLEIGCGSWTQIRDHCVTVGAHYEAIDTQSEYYGRPSAATRIENLAHLSFSDQEFDVVIGNQTLEHWEEFGCSIALGLYQCARVLKPGGELMLNVPLHFHGSKDFLLGDQATIRKKISNYFSGVQFELWRSPSAPLEPFYAHPNYWVLKNREVSILAVTAVRDARLFEVPPVGVAWNRKLSRFQHYPWSYILYRAWRKVAGKRAEGP